MHISHIQAEGLKGRSFAYNLTPLVLVAGPNFAGKTAIADAIRIALIGSLPEAGGRPNDLLDLSPTGRVRIRATVSASEEAGFTIDRIFEKGKSPQGTASGGGIPDMTGIPLLDPDEYFGLSAAGQVNYVFSRIPLPEDCTPASVLARIRKIEVPGDSTEETEEARAHVVGLVEAALKAHGVADGLEELARKGGILKNAYTAWNKAEKDTIGAVRTLTDLKNREGECSAETLESIEQSIAKANEQLTKNTEAMGAIQERVRRAQATEDRRKQIREFLAKPPENFDALIASRTVDLNTAVARMDELAPQVIKNTVQDAESAKLCAEAKYEKALEAMESTQADVNEATRMLAELEEAPCCPFCKSKGKGWKAKLKAVYEETLTRAQTAHREAVQAATVAEEANGKASLARLEANRLHKDFRAAMDQRDSLEHQLEHLTAAKDRWETTSNQLQQELKGLAESEIPNQEEVDNAISAQRAAKDYVLSLQRQRADALRLQQDIRRAAEAESEHRKAEAYCAVIKAIGSELLALKESIVEKVFGKLIETANGLFGSVLKSPIAYHDGAIGRWEGPTFISNKAAFSGTERTLIFIAIAAALSTTAPLRLVILDELARLTREKQDKVRWALTEAVTKGDIDQAIVILPSDTPNPGAVGWTTINLS